MCCFSLSISLSLCLSLCLSLSLEFDGLRKSGGGWQKKIKGRGRKRDLRKKRCGESGKMQGAENAPAAAEMASKTLFMRSCWCGRCGLSWRDNAVLAAPFPRAAPADAAPHGSTSLSACESLCHQRLHLANPIILWPNTHTHTHTQSPFAGLRFFGAASRDHKHRRAVMKPPGQQASSLPDPRC